MNRKQKLALFEGCYDAEHKAIVRKDIPIEMLCKGISLGYRTALADSGLLTEYEKWKSQQEG